MLRFVNAHRVASVGLVAALVLVVVTMSTRLGTDAGSNATTEDVQPTIARASTPASGDVPGSDSSVTSGESAATGELEPDDPSRVDMPVDPFGSRLDRSEAGARQSALDFAGTVQQRLLYLTDDAARFVLDDWSDESFDSATLEANIDDLSVLRSTLTASGGAIWWSVTPIASKVDAYDPDRARVSVWLCQIVGSTVDPARGGDAIAPTVDFRTVTIDMVWTAGSGWSIWATSATDGPVPMMVATSTMTSPIEFMDTLGSFTLVKEHS